MMTLNVSSLCPRDASLSLILRVSVIVVVVSISDISLTGIITGGTESKTLVQLLLTYFH